MRTAFRLLLMLSLGIAIPSAMAQATQSTTMHRIGVLTAPIPGLTDALRNAFRELGYVEGKNLLIEWRHSAGSDQELLSMARQLTGCELVPGSGGVRKVRWARPGMGKRGGLRVIYFVRYQPSEFWMLTLYAKAKREDVPAHVLKQLLEAFRDG
jgi:hypothetical protein